MSEDAGTAVMLSSRDDVVQDLSQREEIITVDHQLHMSIDELLKVIKGANGMPVLFVPSSDGRLTAVAVDGLPNLVPTNHGFKGSAGKDQQDFRAWLLLLASLIATVTFTAGLTPPGGFWSADGIDKDKKYLAGSPVMLYKLRMRYMLFYCSNTAAFFTSMLVVGMLAKNRNNDLLGSKIFVFFVGSCLCFFGASYITGTWVSFPISMYSIICFVIIFFYLVVFASG